MTPENMLHAQGFRSRRQIVDGFRVLASHVGEALSLISLRGNELVAKGADSPYRAGAVPRGG